jgi:hypothetical protein
MYDGEPMITPEEVSPDLASPSTVAIPKSVNATRPSSPIRMLLGLTSRCSTPAA